LTSLSLDQYSKTSVGYFPVLPSLSVSKLLILRNFHGSTCEYFVRGDNPGIFSDMNIMESNLSPLYANEDYFILLAVLRSDN
jgi:hypothetical protein